MVSSSSCTYLFLNIGAALLEHHEYLVLNAHICECYPSLEPISINGFLLPRRYLPFVDLQLPFHTIYPSLRASMVWPLLYYCNMQRAPTELGIIVRGFKSSVFWMEFNEYMINIKNHSFSGSNAKICLVIPFIQEFFSSVEVLELGSYPQYGSPCLEEDIHVISYVLLYNILTSRQPHLKHIKLFGIPDSIERVMSTVVELLNVTCTNTFQVNILFVHWVWSHCLFQLLHTCWKASLSCLMKNTKVMTITNSRQLPVLPAYHVI